MGWGLHDDRDTRRYGPRRDGRVSKRYREKTESEEERDRVELERKKRRQARRDFEDMIDWKTIEAECAALANTCEPEEVKQVYQYFRDIDNLQTPRQFGDLEPKKLRHRIRHIAQAFNLEPTEFFPATVPGREPLPTAFKMPSDVTRIAVAKLLKKPLERAIKEHVKEEEEARIKDQQEEGRIPRQAPEVTEEAAAVHRDIMASIDDTLRKQLGEKPIPRDEVSREFQEPDVNLPPRSPGIVEGEMSVEEYRALKEQSRGDIPMVYTKYIEDDGTPKKSLMEMAREGQFGDTRQHLQRYLDARQKTGGLWGKSKAAQQRLESEFERKEDRRLQREEAQRAARESSHRGAEIQGGRYPSGSSLRRAEEEGTGEPWERFDREAVFAAASGMHKPEDFDKLMQSMAMHRQEAFQKGEGL